MCLSFVTRIVRRLNKGFPLRVPVGVLVRGKNGLSSLIGFKEKPLF